MESAVCPVRPVSGHAGCFESIFSQTSGSHNELIVVREITFHWVMKLSTALASFPPPSRYLCVTGVTESQTDTRRSVRFVTLHRYFIKRSHLCSFSRCFRAVLRQCRGVGAAHLLLLQRDRHGVQLSGEGTDPVHDCTPLHGIISVGVYTKFSPTSVVTFHPPVPSSAYKSLHQTNKSQCEQTTDVDIKPRGKYCRFLCFLPRLQLGVHLISASAELIIKYIPSSHLGENGSEVSRVFTESS